MKLNAPEFELRPNLAKLGIVPSKVLAWDPVGRIRFKIVVVVGGGDINFARNYSLVCAEIFGNAARVWFLKKGGEGEIREKYARELYSSRNE